MTKQQTTGNEHLASAKAMSLPVSAKHCIEICDYIRYKKTSFAKAFLEDVSQLKKAVPFKRFKRDMGHKVGNMAAGRFPQKAAKEFLKLIKSVEANAQNKGLNTANLKIVRILSNRASAPVTGGRHRQGTKRTHLEIQVKEGQTNKVEKKAKTSEKKVDTKPVVEEKKTEITKVEEKTVEVKEEVKSAGVEEPVVESETQEEVVPKEETVEESTPEPEVKEEETPTPVEEKKEEAEEEVKEEVLTNAVEELPAQEISPEELLQQAQAKAAELNSQQRVQETSKDVQEAAELFETLKKKGTLRKEQ